MKPSAPTRDRPNTLVGRPSTAGGQTERRRKVVAAAAQLFADKRFDEVRMEEISQLAGVGKGTLYTYFADKEELYFAVVFEGISRLNEGLRVNASSPIEPEKRLRQIVHGIVSFFSQNRFFFRLMSVEDSRSEGGKGENRRRWREERRVQLEAIETVLQSGRELGLFTVRDAHVEACILRDMVRSVIINSGDRLSVGEMVEVILGVFLDGVREPMRVNEEKRKA
ncbi:TetR/AcrR family transcriptional regulator [Candidatus Latescibacterota bacterium]